MSRVRGTDVETNELIWLMYPDDSDKCIKIPSANGDDVRGVVDARDGDEPVTIVQCVWKPNLRTWSAHHQNIMDSFLSELDSSIQPSPVITRGIIVGEKDSIDDLLIELYTCSQERDKSRRKKAQNSINNNVTMQN